MSEEQPFLSDEMTPPVDKDIEAAADKYQKIRDQRMKLTEKEVEAQNELVFIMRSKNLTEYHYDSKIVLLETGKIKAKVRSEKDEPEEKE